MAVTSIKTLTPVDEWARIMSIPGWLFNQVYHPCVPLRGSCDKLWFNGVGMTTASSLLGREDVAMAMSQAERMIASAVGFWPGRAWISGEEHLWEPVKRGSQQYVPRYYTRWDHVEAFGVEAWEDQSLYPTAVVYSDSNGDGCDNWATVTFATTITDPEEVVIVPDGCNPASTQCEIRPLDITISGGVCTAQGPRWLFVIQDYYKTLTEIQMDDDVYFINLVNAYRHYTDTTEQAQYVWGAGDGCLTTPCVESCQSACAHLVDRRLGKFYAVPATYGSGAWTKTNWLRRTAPTSLRVYYETRYRDRTSMSEYVPSIFSSAVVHLANTLMPNFPCGCAYSRNMFEEDREEADVYNWSSDMAMRYFGSTKKGAVKAAGLLRRLDIS